MEAVQAQMEIPTPEAIWAILRENAAQQKETDRLMKETDRRWQKTERYLKRVGKQIGFVPEKFGKLAKRLVAPDIFKRFNELGYHFCEMSPGGQRIIDEKTGKTKTEIDLLLENGEAILAVEVKVTPALKDIEHHLKRLEILREHRRGINDQRKVLGAIA